MAKKIIAILVIVFTIEYIAQSLWITHIQWDARARISQCKRQDSNLEMRRCFENYIYERNQKAVLGVNGYLVSIILLSIGGGIAYLRRRKVKNECKY